MDSLSDLFQSSIIDAFTFNLYRICHPQVPVDLQCRFERPAENSWFYVLTCSGGFHVYHKLAIQKYCLIN